MANGERSRDGIYFQGDEYDYMHNHTFTAQHLMPLEEEDNDGAILMLQGAQRSKLQLCENMSVNYCAAPENIYLHTPQGRSLEFTKERENANLRK